jgi:hypothetical protein
MSGIFYGTLEDPINEIPKYWGEDSKRLKEYYKDYPWGRCSKCGRLYPDYNKQCDYCWNEVMEEIEKKERLAAEEAKKPKPPDVPAFIVDPERVCK